MSLVQHDALAALDDAARLVQLSLHAMNIAQTRVRLTRISRLSCDACRTPAQEFIGDVGGNRLALPGAARFGLALVQEEETRRRLPVILCPGCCSRISHHSLTHRGVTLHLVSRISSQPPSQP